MKGKPCSLARLKYLLRYEPKTGNWFWVNPPAHCLKSGAKAGGNSHGYIRIKINAEQYAAHRLAWFYMTGKWPNKRIDHKNNNPTDNRWRNLRFATHGQNIANSKLRKDNTCGLKGVTRQYKNRFAAQIQRNGRHMYLGYFKTAEEAHAAYVRAAKKLFGSYARVA